MIDKKIKFSIFAAGLSLTGLCLFPVDKVQAGGFYSSFSTTMSYDFSLTIDTGLLEGQIFDGSFSYDDSGTGLGEEYLDIQSFDFNFLGINYGLTTHTNWWIKAVLFEGKFVGLDMQEFAEDVGLYFLPGFTKITESVFFYHSADMQGEGNFSYSLTSKKYESVPEPNFIVGLGILGTLGTLGAIKNSDRF